MTRCRSMHALLGTLALIAGCSTTHRTEVTGVVRDRATGRVIPGARVIGADGTFARTDVFGRFTLYVRSGSSADVRVTAQGHASERVELEGLEARVDLAPTDLESESFVMPSSEAHVLTWVEETWVLTDGGLTDGASDTQTSHVASWAGGATDDGGAVCAGCHQDEATAIIGGAHVGLSDSCLACHAPRLGPDPSASCARCHGSSEPSTIERELASLAAHAAASLDAAIAEGARTGAVHSSCGGLPARFTQVGASFVLVDAQGRVVGDCDQDGLLDPGEDWEDVEPLAPDLAARADALTRAFRDRAQRAHSPLRAASVSPAH